MIFTQVEDILFQINTIDSSVNDDETVLQVSLTKTVHLKIATELSEYFMQNV